MTSQWLSLTWYGSYHFFFFRQAATKILEEAEEIAQLETEAAGGATAVDGTSAEGAEAAQEERAPTEDEEPMNGEEEPAPGTVPAGAFGGTADAEGFFMRKHLSEAGRRASNRYVLFVCLFYLFKHGLKILALSRLAVFQQVRNSGGKKKKYMYALCLGKTCLGQGSLILNPDDYLPEAAADKFQLTKLTEDITV